MGDIQGCIGIHRAAWGCIGLVLRLLGTHVNSSKSDDMATRKSPVQTSG